MNFNDFDSFIGFVTDILDELDKETNKSEDIKSKDSKPECPHTEKAKSEVKPEPETKTEPNPEPELEDEFDTDTKIDESELFNEYRIKKIIDKVIFYNPNTVVFFKDGSVVSVKSTDNETYDPEKGLAMALLKYIFGKRYFRDITAVINRSEVIMEPKRHKKIESKNIKLIKEPNKLTYTMTKEVKKTNNNKKTTNKKTTSSN